MKISIRKLCFRGTAKAQRQPLRSGRVPPYGGFVLYVTG
jgi:hypothetical protein